jgi:phage tail sheath protein FI
MPQPDVFVRILSATAPRTLPTSTATCFAAGVTTRGPVGKPRRAASLTDFLNYFGMRIAASPSLYDWADVFFNEGGSELFMQRVFGAGAKAASVTLKKAAAAALEVSAGQAGEEDPGLWGNELKIAVVAATGGYRLQVSYENVIVEESPVLVTSADAEGWSKTYSQYVLVKATAETPPDVVAAKALSGGTAGAAVGDADYELALAKIGAELGPGQVCVPGITTEAVQRAALTHARENNRFALLDGKDTITVATLVTQAQAAQTAVEKGRRYGQMFAPWDVAPGLTSSTTRTVPPSARAAAQYAKVDALGNPNQGAAGRRGTAVYVTELSQTNWTPVQREELNNAGITVSRRRFGNVIQTWGIRSLADQVNDEAWSFAPNVRTVMAYAAQAQVVGESYEFANIDGFGRVLGEFKRDLIGAAKVLYDVGALYGLSPSDAFAVNVGASVNTPASLAAGKVLAQVSLRISPLAEQTVIYIIKVPITQSLI